MGKRRGVGRGVGAVYSYSRQMKGKAQQLAPPVAAAVASSTTSTGPSTPGPSDVIIQEVPVYPPPLPRGARRTGNKGDPKLIQARGVMHPKPRSHGSEQRRGRTTKVTKDIPTNAEMLSSLDGDAPGTALLRLTEGIRIAPHTTQKIKVYYPDPTHAGGSVNYRIEAAQPWGNKVDDSLPVECRVMPGVSTTRQGQQGRGGIIHPSH